MLTNQSIRVVNIAVLVLLPIVSAILFNLSMQVSAIHFICSVETGIGDTSSLVVWQFPIPILLSSGALVNSVNNNTTVPERVKARTVVLHLN